MQSCKFTFPCQSQSALALPHCVPEVCGGIMEAVLEHLTGEGPKGQSAGIDLGAEAVGSYTVLNFTVTVLVLGFQGKI